MTAQIFFIPSEVLLVTVALHVTLRVELGVVLRVALRVALGVALACSFPVVACALCDPLSLLCVPVSSTDLSSLPYILSIPSLLSSLHAFHDTYLYVSPIFLSFFLFFPS